MYFLTDWAILNDTKPKQLQRILVQFHHLSESEIHLAGVLLESYHAVYRRDRLKQRQNCLLSGQAKVNQLCPPPTVTQLHEIAQRVNAKVALALPTEDVLTQLQALAQRLRHYHIYARGKFRATACLDQLKNCLTCDRAKHTATTSDRIQPLELMNHWEHPNNPAACFALPHGEMQCP